MKTKKRLKTVLGIILLLATQSQLQSQTNTFEIGMMGLEYAYMTDANGNIITIPKVAGYNSSWNNVIAADGFNTVVSYMPDATISFANWKNYILLAKNNSLKVMDHTQYFFKPIGQTSSDGINKYDSDLPTCSNRAAPNANARYSQIYNDSAISSHIFGHILGNELSYFHSFMRDGVCVNGWCDCNNAEYYTAEMPPQKLSEALVNFKAVRNANGVNNQKLIFGVSPHGQTLENYTDSIGWYDEEDYLNIPERADMVLEGAYYSTDFLRWADAPSCTRNYLGKFRSIDFIKSKHYDVLAQIGIGLEQGNLHLPYAISSNQSIKNANQLWFQTYTSIIHGANGVHFEGLSSAYDLNLPMDVANKNYKDNASNPDRFDSIYTPAAYRNLIKYLGRELRYLCNKNLISTDPGSIVYTKTTNADANCILPASTTYLPAVVSSTDARDLTAAAAAIGWPAPSLNNFHRTEENGLRYTIRTNGTEVIMIISNPNPFPVNAVNLNFNNLSNNIIRNSTGVRVLFEGANPTDTTVRGTSYKKNRNAGINLLNMAIAPTSYLINYPSQSNKQVSLAFGPFDVHILKFVTGTVPNHNNGWDLVNSNNGSGTIGGWKVSSTDKFIAGDFDGNGTQELMCIQTQSSNSNAWATMLKYDSQNNIWNWGWSNYGNNFINAHVQNWAIRAADYYYAGNFDGVAGDELLCAQGDGNYMTLMKFVDGSWKNLWCNWSIYNMDFVPYKGNLIIGDFDGDGKANALGVNASSLKMFDYVGTSTNGNFVAGSFSTTDPNHTLYAYKNNLRAGDFDGNGKTDLLGFKDAPNANWATVFYYNTNVTGFWQFGESTYGGSNAFGGWYLPASANDSYLVGNVDADSKDEVLCIQGGSAGAWASTVYTYNGGYIGGWSNYGTPAYIDDWAVSESGGSNTKYLMIKPTTSSKKYLLGMRLYSGCNNNFVVNMYQTNSSSTNYRPLAADEMELTANKAISIYPNPTSDEFKIAYSLSEASENVKVELYNTVGQLIKEITVTGAQGANENTIDVSNVAKGMYIIRVAKEGKFFSEKISIQR